MKLRIFILAGGQGRRLWPLSNKVTPKQFCRITSDKTLLEETIDRYKELGKCTVVTNIKDTAKLKNLKNADLLVEKESLDTAHCLNIILEALHDKQTALIVPSDHYIQDPKPLLDTIISVQTDDLHMYLFGLEPQIPLTNLGYLKIASNSNKIESFYEKPNKNQAKKLIQEGCLHNSGIILTSKEALLHNMKKYAPHLFNKTKKRECFNKAILELSQYLLAYKVNTPFLDLGTYQAIYEHLKHKKQTDKHNCNTLIHATSRQVKAFGMQDTIIIESSAGVLVFHKDYLEKMDQLLK